MKTRLQQLQLTFKELGIDALLVTDPVNMSYLTGFDGDGLVLVTAKTTILVTDDRYATALAATQHPFKVSITRNYLEVAIQLAHECQVMTLGFEDQLAYRTFAWLKQLTTMVLVPVDAIIERQRTIKSVAEIELLTRSAKLAVKGFEKLLPVIKPGVSERWVANQLDCIMKTLGASGPSFETIVASGYRSALPHGAASDKLIQFGELVTIDFGYFVDGYTSDLTRTIAVGDLDTQLKEVYRVVQHAQRAIIKAVRAGVTGQRLDQIGRQIISETGYGAYFNHGTGHGIGLAIHEGPDINTRARTPLQVNQVITVEPGIYLPDVGGVRIEDDVLVQTTHGQVLTASDTGLIIL